MLENANVHDLIDSIWHAHGCAVQVPIEWAKAVGETGQTHAHYDDHRRFVRYVLLSRAVLEMRGEYHCVYTKDVSRLGIGFLHHEQILPCEQVRVLMSHGTSPLLEVRRCRRVVDDCFECGAVVLDEEHDAIDFGNALSMSH